jgi:hypothetical protein
MGSASDYRMIRAWLSRQVPVPASNYVVSGLCADAPIELNVFACVYPTMPTYRVYVRPGYTDAVDPAEVRAEIATCRIPSDFSAYNPTEQRHSWRAACDLAEMLGLPIGFYAKGTYTQTGGQMALLWIMHRVNPQYFLEQLRAVAPVR